MIFSISVVSLVMSPLHLWFYFCLLSHFLSLLGFANFISFQKPTMLCCSFYYFLVSILFISVLICYFFLSANFGIGLFFFSSLRYKGVYCDLSSFWMEVFITMNFPLSTVCYIASTLVCSFILICLFWFLFWFLLWTLWLFKSVFFYFSHICELSSSPLVI